MNKEAEESMLRTALQRYFYRHRRVSRLVADLGPSSKSLGALGNGARRKGLQRAGLLICNSQLQPAVAAPNVHLSARRTGVPANVAQPFRHNLESFGGKPVIDSNVAVAQDLHRNAREGRESRCETLHRRGEAVFVVG